MMQLLEECCDKIFWNYLQSNSENYFTNKLGGVHVFIKVAGHQSKTLLKKMKFVKKVNFEIKIFLSFPSKC